MSNGCVYRKFNIHSVTVHAFSRPNVPIHFVMDQFDFIAIPQLIAWVLKIWTTIHRRFSNAISGTSSANKRYKYMLKSIFIESINDKRIHWVQPWQQIVSNVFSSNRPMSIRTQMAKNGSTTFAMTKPIDCSIYFKAISIRHTISCCSNTFHNIFLQYFIQRMQFARENVRIITNIHSIF